MSTKDYILELLEKNRGKTLSGEEIANSLNISRTAVWKAIKSLERDGYHIQAVTNRGYSLSNENNILSIQGLLPFLSKSSYTERITIYKSLESTNKTAKEMAINGCEHGTVIIADSQTSGKGRYGKSFYSPSENGLYISFVLHSQFLELSNITLITLATAVAVCRAIQTVTGKSPEIKWVNDILLNGKKICGILTEAITDFESGNIDWIVVGIGINIYTSDFPSELNSIATSIFPDETGGIIRNRLAAEIINIFLSPNTWLKDKGLYSEYKDRLTLLGHTITVLRADETFNALALDIDEAGQLIVEKSDGTILKLFSEEVSIVNSKQ